MIIWGKNLLKFLDLLSEFKGSLQSEDSLEQVMREENTENSLPVITIGNLDRLSEADYRERCAERLIEIVVDIDNYKGTGRLFIP
jgi:hypothetical protein